MTPHLFSGAQVSQSAFAFLFSEFIQYIQQRVNTVEELQTKSAATARRAAVAH